MGKILVTITRHSHIGDLMPYLEMLARPGMTVIFLFPYPVASRSYLLDHWVTTESAKDAMAVGRSIMERYSQVAQKELARKLIVPALTALQDQGVRVEIHLHSGSLAKAINSYSIDQDIHWVMTPFPPRFGWRGYLSAKKAAPLGGSTYLLSVRRDRSFSERNVREDALSKGRARSAEKPCGEGRCTKPPSFELGAGANCVQKEGKIMPIETLIEDTLTSAAPAETSDPLSEIVHDLKNCMSILLYWVETLATDRNSPAPNEDSIDDLKKLALKMNGLIERLDYL